MKMKNLSKLILVFASLFIVLILNPETTKAQEIEDQKEFNYIVGSDKGPDRWGYLYEEWADCKNGNLQSPIDLLYWKMELAPHLGDVRRFYQSSPATLTNRGHDIALEWRNGAGPVLINGDIYELQQCHWHSPSEHHINGIEFALELHMVHHNVQLNKTAVVAVLYNIGLPDPFLSEIKDELEIIAVSDQELDMGMIDPNRISTFSRPYYRYLGSLTTPPCTEGVIWTINEKVRSVSYEQLKLLRNAVSGENKNNARPLQPLNGRDILYYNPYFGGISDI